MKSSNLPEHVAEQHIHKSAQYVASALETNGRQITKWETIMLARLAICSSGAGLLSHKQDAEDRVVLPKIRYVFQNPPDLQE